MHDIAQMLMMAACGQGGEIGVVSSSVEGGDFSSTTFTTSSLSIGTATSTRRVLACIAAMDAVQGTPPGDPTSVTIGGVTATKLAGFSQVASPEHCGYSIWIATVPSGTTAAVVANFSRTVVGYSVRAFALTSAIPEPVDTRNGSNALSVVRKGAAFVFGAQAIYNYTGAAGVVITGDSGWNFTVSPSARQLRIALAWGTIPSTTETLSTISGYALAVSFAPT